MRYAAVVTINIGFLSFLFVPAHARVQEPSGNGDLSLGVQEKLQFKRPNETVSRITFSKDGQVLAASHSDVKGPINKLSLTAWEIPGGKEKFTIPNPKNMLRELATGRPTPFVPEKGAFIGFFPGDERYLVMLSGKGQVRSVKSGDLEREFEVYRPTAGHSSILSRDGKKLATVRFTNKSLMVCNADSGESVVSFEGQHVKNNIAAICFGPADKVLASVDVDGLLIIWDVKNGNVRNKLSYKKRPIQMVLSHDEKWLAVGFAGSEVVFIDTAGYKEVLTLKTALAGAENIAFQPNGSLFATGGGTTVQVWELSTKKQPDKEPNPPVKAKTPELNPAPPVQPVVPKKPVAAEGQEKFVGKNGLVATERFRFNSRQTPRALFDISPGGKWLADYDDKEGKIRILDPHTAKIDTTLGSNLKNVYKLSFTPDAQHLLAYHATATLNKLTMFEIATGRETFSVVAGNAKTSLAWALDPKAEFIGIAGGGGRTVQFRETKGGLPDKFLSAPKETVDALTFSPDGKSLAAFHNRGRAITSDNAVKLWNMETRRVIWTSNGHDKFSSKEIVFTPSGKHVAFSHGRTIKLLDAKTGDHAEKLEFPWVVERFAFRPDGAWIAGAYREPGVPFDASERVVSLRDVKSGDELLSIKTLGAASGVGFDATGNRLITAGGEHIQVWELSTQKSPKKDQTPPDQPLKLKTDAPTPKAKSESGKR